MSGALNLFHNTQFKLIQRSGSYLPLKTYRRRKRPLRNLLRQYFPLLCRHPRRSVE
nr:MAG TPA_asm: hypothetical protein [Caudoviricetes sp.]